MATLARPALGKPAFAKPPGPLELMPGDVAIGQAGEQFKTLLGSCVAVVLTDPRRTVGSMCHIVHVGLPNAENRHNTAYGVAAMHEMFTRLRVKGINPRMCEAYVYGGGNMFPNLFRQKHVGASNVDWVLHYLSVHDVPVLEHCLGGNGYRKISWTVGPQDPIVEVVFQEQGLVHGR
jgi:chemotaxis protein CheD